MKVYKVKITSITELVGNKKYIINDFHEYVKIHKHITFNINSIFDDDEIDPILRCQFIGFSRVDNNPLLNIDTNGYMCNYHDGFRNVTIYNHNQDANKTTIIHLKLEGCCSFNGNYVQIPWRDYNIDLCAKSEKTFNLYKLFEL